MHIACEVAFLCKWLSLKCHNTSVYSSDVQTYTWKDFLSDLIFSSSFGAIRFVYNLNIYIKEELQFKFIHFKEELQFEYIHYCNIKEVLQFKYVH